MHGTGMIAVEILDSCGVELVILIGGVGIL